MFVEQEQDKGQMIVGFRLHPYNYTRAPPGIIRVARFRQVFCPKYGLGYYSEVHLHLLIRYWRRCRQKRQEILEWKTIAEKHLLCDDIENIVIEFF